MTVILLSDHFALRSVTVIFSCYKQHFERELNTFVCYHL